MDFGWRITFDDYLDDVSTVYQDPNAIPEDAALRTQLYDQHSYVEDGPGPIPAISMILTPCSGPIPALLLVPERRMISAPLAPPPCPPGL